MKPALSWDSYVSRHLHADQLRWQSLQCSWTSSLELSAGRLRAVVFIWTVWPCYV